jgi:hypothetical protein
MVDITHISHIRAIIPAVFLIWLPLLTPAQTLSNYANQQNIETLGGGDINGMVMTLNKEYEGVRGTPFLSDQWARGAVSFRDGKTHENLPLKLDLYANEVLYKRPAGDSVFLNTRNIRQLTIIDDATGASLLFKNQPFSSDAQFKPKSDFYQVIYEGKSGFYLKRRKSILKANYTGAYNEGRAYDEFVNESIYYLRKPDNSLEKIKLNKSSVLSALKDKQSQVKSFVSKEKLALKEEADVVKVLEYYDSL